MEAGFDNSLYIHKQTEHIRQRIAQWGGKLYLEFGGKLFDDYHAARVLPGFDPNGKIRLLYEMREQAEIIFTVSAGDIEKTKMRADLGISYDMEVLRLIDDITHMGIAREQRGHHAVHRPGGSRRLRQKADDARREKLHPPPHQGLSHGHRLYLQRRRLRREPLHRDLQASCGGDGPRPRLRQAGHLPLARCTTKSARAVVAGYAKFETFPIWNLPLKHPVNLAYEAATADLDGREHDRPVPSGGLRRHHRQLQPGRGGLPHRAQHPLAHHRGRKRYTNLPRIWA